MGQYIISYSPHAKDPVDVQKIMWGVVIAMIPAFLVSVYFYGIRAITVTAVSVIACVVFILILNILPYLVFVDTNG